MKLRMPFIAMGLLGCAVSGCGTVAVRQMYDGPAQTGAETAALIVPFTVDLLEFDGKKYKSDPLLSAVKETRLVMLPGHHEIRARYSSPYEEPSRAERPVWKTSPQVFSLDAAAGKTYRFDVRLPGGKGPDVQELESTLIWIAEESPAAAPAVVSMPEPPRTNAEAQAVSSAAELPAPKPNKRDSAELKNLKIEWIKASEDDRSAFLKWAEDNR